MIVPTESLELRPSNATGVSGVVGFDVAVYAAVGGASTVIVCVAVLVTPRSSVTASVT